MSLLVIAPAGCGKTEALVLRAAGLIARDQVNAPSRLLLATFSKKARDNIRDRALDHVSPTVLQNRMTIANFHGLAARIVRAHGNVIGLTPDVLLPESDWVDQQCRLRGLDKKRSDFIKATLRDLKLHPHDDEEILRKLEEVGDKVMSAIEAQRQQENRLTYEDLLRQAERILQNPRVAEIYSTHFGAVIVDEFQDLTLQQLRVILILGKGRTTFAGDLAQGIYGFAGASPVQVLQVIKASVLREVVFSTSHRSSPAVLGLVNTLTEVTGGQELTAAEPHKWPGGGLCGAVLSDSDDIEAKWVVDLCKFILEKSSSQRIGVISRTAPRRRTVDLAVASSGLPWFRWDDPLLEKDVARALRSGLQDFSQRKWTDAPDQRSYLRGLVGVEIFQDPDSAKSMLGAIDWLQDQLIQGTGIDEVQKRVRGEGRDSLLDAAGVHLLSGHAGKGQQFDWVCVIGAEEGSIPFVKAQTAESLDEEGRILAVMLSRARHGAMVFAARRVRMPWGDVVPQRPSRYLELLRRAPGLLYNDAVVSWLRAADWESVPKV